MASRVRELPEDLIARIAAGEVVERPASVLKELIENSVDAGATEISVTLEGAGRRRLAISDNGCGMNPDEAKLAMRRHATSKIERFEDLETIGTFGFRGEALPSIAAVSRFRLRTRAADESAAWEFSFEGGVKTAEGPAAREPGTTIDVSDLFFNTPARLKFLKADATERAACLKVVEEMAFSAPGITIRLKVDDAAQETFAGQRASSDEERLRALRARASDVWGTKWANGWASVLSATPHFKVWGLVTDPEHHQGSARNQNLFINGRPVQNRRLARAVYDGFLGQLPSMRHPAWILFLEVNPRAIDVNVHPSKREVKLTHESEIFGFLVHAVRDALSRAAAGSAGLFAPAAAPAVHSSEALPVGAGGFTGDVPPGRAVSTALDQLYRSIGGTISRESPLFDYASALPADETGFLRQSLTAVGQVRQMFILATSDSDLLVADQHAAHEKILYEKLLKNARSESPAMQMLLVPFSWEVSRSVSTAIHGRLSALAAMGFQIEPFGGTTCLVRGYPAVLGEKFDLHSLLDGLSDVFCEAPESTAGRENDFQHRLCAMSACKAAVKAGDPLPLADCQHILDELRALDAPLTCPHGRPTVVPFAYADLLRRFRRT